MRSHTAIWLIAFVGLGIILLVTSSGAFPVLAHNAAAVRLAATPTVSPTINGGTASWTIQSRTFTSHYPRGFMLSIQASSTGGIVTTVKTFWSHTPGTRRSRPAVYDAATQTWTTRWDPTGSEETLPAWVAVDYWFVLTDAANNTYLTDTIHTEYADNTKAWGRAESDDLIVFWEKSLPDEIGKLALDAMARNRDLYRRAWGRILSYKPRAILYATQESFREWSPPFDPARILGTTSRTWGGTVQRNSEYGIFDLAYGTIPHEIAHLYQFDLGMVADSWWIEGDATFFELHQQYDYEARARSLAQQPDFPSLREGLPTRGNNARDGYDVGYAFIKYLTDTYGIEVHKKILDYMVKGSVLFDAIAKATGKPFDDVELGFRAWLGMPEPSLPTRAPTLNFQFPPTPTYEVNATPTSS